jgi:hypothetical protein
LALGASAAQAALTAGGIAALDGSGNNRDTFTNVETIALRQVVSNSVASDNMISFVFTIYNPSGGAVFHHTGNSARGALGNSNSQLSGLAISRFYSVPGVYKFRGQATLDGSTVTQEKSFQISSPNINLIYPPNGARGLTDKPVIFRWVSSGASSYKITVSKNPGLYPEVHSGNTPSGLYTYPDNLSSSDGNLVADTNYYWKVEGVDAAGSKIAESNTYSFTLKSQASSQSRNVAVTLVEMTDWEADFSQPLHFRAVVQNTGGTSESGISIKMTLSGMAAQDSPKNIGMLTAGETQQILFTAFMPTGQSEGLAVACVDLFDDNIPDNCKTRMIAKVTGAGTGPQGSKETRSLSYQEMWDEVVKRLGGDVAQALDGYTFDSIECANCSSGELNDLMLALISGDATLSGAAIAESYQPAGTTPATPDPVTAADEPEDEPEMDLELEAADKREANEWSGYTNSIKSKTPFFYTIQSRKVWEKVWGMISSEEAPDVDFGDKTVIGVIAGTENNADTVRVIAKRQVGEKTVFDYYMTESSGKNPAVPYIFKTYDKVKGKMEFKRLDVGR